MSQTETIKKAVESLKHTLEEVFDYVSRPDISFRKVVAIYQKEKGE